jgi:cytochrome d ubiquinol oxidase subunit I
VWIFGWDKLPKGLHLASIWLVAIGANISALWILIANSFMQQPVGYVLNDITNRAEMEDFGELITNPNILVQYPHVVSSGITTAAFFVLGISAWHLLRQKNNDFFRRSFRLASVYGIIGIVLVIMVGHSQAQHMVETQPMKMAAAEALWESEDPAAMSLFTIGNERERRDVFAIRLPRVLSLLAYNQLEGEVKGINDLQAEYEKTYGPGDYVPPVAVSYWSFRMMVGAGMLMLIAVGYALLLAMGEETDKKPRFMKAFIWLLPLPYLATATGWILTEVGRAPWIVFGLMKIEDGVSPNVSVAMVLFTLIGFTLIYGILMVADIYLLQKFARRPEMVGLVPVDVELDTAVSIVPTSR